MKKIIISAAVGLSVFGGAAAFAAGFTNTSSSNVAAANVTVNGCNSANVTYTLDTNVGANFGKIVAINVNLSSPDCQTGTYALTALDNVNAVMGTASNSFTGHAFSAVFTSPELDPAVLTHVNLVVVAP